MDNLILIGFMGCGKTSLGVKLANVYGFTFIDTDEYIEKKQGMKISEIFSSKGEDYFRTLEYQCLQELQNRCHHCLISTGGGLPLLSKNVSILRQIGTIVFLKTSKEVTYERLKGDIKRPLLQCDNPQKKIEELLTIRIPLYEKAADYVVCTDGKSFYGLIEEIGQLILKKEEE